MKIAPTLVLIVLLVGGCFPDETIEVSAPTLAEAEAKGAWVPQFAPPSARDFEESHNLDTNWSFGRFRYDRAIEAELIRTLRPISPQEISTFHWRNKMGSWRPELRSALGPQLAQQGIVLRSATWDARHTVWSRYVVVIDTKNQTVYFWTE